MRVTLILLFVSISLEAKLPSKRDNERIYGGQEAAEGQFPYIISFRHPTPQYHHCGGSIITTNFVITAAHCCEDTLPEKITIVAGSTTIDEGGVSYKVQKTYIHPNFTVYNLNDDICLVHLTEDISLLDRIQVIQLNQSPDDSIQAATVSGWGFTPNGLPNELYYLSTSIFPHQQCVDAWGDNAYYPIIDTEICTFTKFGQGTCQGDSGGPLVTYDDDQNPILTGLVSWGNPCALGYPDIYTKVASYIDWINSIINNSED